MAIAQSGHLASTVFLLKAAVTRQTSAAIVQRGLDML